MRLDKKKLRREIETERRKKARARLLELREKIKEARAAKREAILGVQLDCRQKRQELRESCQLRGVRARTQGKQEIEQRRGELDAERRYERIQRAGDRPRALRSTSAERRQESDDEVRSNLQPEMVAVFNAVRKHIKGSPRKSRTEAFFQWAEENPDEVFDLLQHDADRYLAQLLAEQERTERELRRRSVAGVPF